MKLNDIRLNKKGTIGTEPVAKKNKKGVWRKGTEVKFGKLGSVFLPGKKLNNSSRY
tara:strand:- start:495 stop:662 length:168 start_codon:yes stop_codon:yes gene_type:complete